MAGNPRMIGIRPGYARIAARVAAHERLSTQEIRDQMQAALKPEVFRTLYGDFAAQNLG